MINTILTKQLEETLEPIKKRPSINLNDIISLITREVEDYYSPLLVKTGKEPDTYEFWFAIISADKTISYTYGTIKNITDKIMFVSLTRSNSKVEVPKKGYITSAIQQTFVTKINAKLKDSFCLFEINTISLVKLIRKMNKSAAVGLELGQSIAIQEIVTTCKFYSKFTFLPRPMLAQKVTDKLIDKIGSSRVVIQPKYNGHRCLASFHNGKCVALSSRDGEFIYYPALIDSINEYCQEKLSEDVIKEIKFIDGELYKHGVPLQTITSIVNTVNNTEKDLDYIIYDVCPITFLETDYIDSVYDKFKSPYFKTPIEERNKYVFSITSSIKALTSDVKQNPDYIISKHKMYTNAGYEGIMLRTSKSYFEDTRSNTLLKVKTFLDDEFQIKSYTLGKRGEEDLVIQLLTKQGKEFKAKPVGTLEEKKLLIGILNDKLKNSKEPFYGTVKFFEYTRDKIPMHPIFISTR